MNLQAISTKQLRQELPEIKERLLGGQSFYWIHRSQPIGIIKPISKAKINQTRSIMSKEEYKELVRKLSGGIKLKKYPTPKQLNKILDMEYKIYV